jgi:Domain of unknown function (DUF4266)
MKTTSKKRQIMAVAAMAIAAITMLGACTTVKEYQKNKLNDGEMIMGSRKIQKTEMSFQSYREGASGANGGKTGGGCGCN